MYVYIKCFDSLKSVFYWIIVFIMFSKYNPFSCIKIINVNSNEPVFYPFSIKTSNNIIDPYAKICVPDVLKDLNVKVFNLMLRTNETRHIKWHETYKCKCRLDASVCNNKQH